MGFLAETIERERVVAKDFHEMTPEEKAIFLQGAAEGNRSATRVLIGGKYPIRVVVDPSVPPDEIQLRVRSMDAFHLGMIRLDLGIV